ncbi:GCN5-like N-acetyltransferase [Psychromonas sp. CNPT3]|uniref:GNAT family N-acetyltransferase n=1 Tax=Psychromonas sp. CNPT3 TaxID=314282 RepID=UPI00006E70E1|nr:GNAT family N-acetyltransferase [Psychromonas sp. CNPT3]AGH81487.1 GCN5-like N-acetyltransferase [Psychromonas sp. CNPT3]
MSKTHLKSLLLRLATLEDGPLLLKWRNDKQTQQASHCSTPIKYSEHEKWLNALLQDPLRMLYVVEKNNVAVGSLRSDFANGEFELSWTVAPTHRGQSIGKQMLSLLADKIKAPIRASIKKGNSASIKIAEYVGMQYVKEEPKGVFHYQRAAIHE